VLGASTVFCTLLVTHAAAGHPAPAAAAREIAAAGGVNGGGGGGKGWSAHLPPASLWSDGDKGSSATAAAPSSSAKWRWFGSKHGSSWWLLGSVVRVPCSTITSLSSFISSGGSAGVCNTELLQQPAASLSTAVKDSMAAATSVEEYMFEEQMQSSEPAVRA
jgi:hypothetical protein